MEATKHTALILGGGFAGLSAARALRCAPVHVRIIDRQNHHLFQPLLYQVASAGLNPSDIASPIRQILRNQKNVEVTLAEVQAIDAGRRRVVLADGEAHYDWLVVCTGATHSYFGRDDWAPFAPGLKDLNDALEIRRRILLAFEAAEREEDPSTRKVALTFVIAGAGPTGVELAGAVAEIARHTLVREFRRFDPRSARVVLVEAGSKVLSAYEAPLNERARAQLEGLGVEVRLGSPVTGVDRQGVSLGSDRIEARTVLWACGVAGSPLAKTLGVPLDKAGRVLVDEALRAPGRPEIFVAGDLCAVYGKDGKPVPAVAPAAMQQGKCAALNIIQALEGKPVKPFRYHDKGSLATIGRAAAVAQLGKIKLSGWIAWIAWAFIHIFFLIGFRNRLIVMFQWAWAYITYDRGVRLITGRVEPLVATSKEPIDSFSNTKDERS
jgi:NADH:ubiquinone reductase (H+-translocating)